MSSANKQSNELMKEFNRHNIDAMVSMNILENIQVLHIDTTRHDKELLRKFIEWYELPFNDNFLCSHDEIIDKFLSKDM